MCMGRISRKWSSAAVTVQYHVSQPSDQDQDKYLTSLLKRALWCSSKAIREHRNEVVHGASVQEQANRLLSTLHTKAKDLYDTYEKKNHMVLGRHQYIFTSWSLEELLWNFCLLDALSVETVLVWKHQEALQEAAWAYFAPTNSTSESDSSFTLGSDSNKIFTASITSWTIHMSCQVSDSPSITTFTAPSSIGQSSSSNSLTTTSQHLDTNSTNTMISTSWDMP